MTRCCVYDLVLDGEIVYVGMTVRPAERRLHHKSYKGGVHPSAEFKIVEWYENSKAARIAERDRIIALKPRYNVKELPTDSATTRARKYTDYKAADQRMIAANAAKWKAACDDLERWIGENPEEAEQTLATWNPNMSAENRRAMIDECKRKLK